MHDDVELPPIDPYPAGSDGERFYARELIRAAEAGEPICPPGLTVLEAIGDLPSIPAGGGEEAMPYSDAPSSAYQQARRGTASILFNHRSRSHSTSMLEKMAMIPEGGRNQELDDLQRLRSTEGEYFSQAYARLHRHGIAQAITTYFHNPGSGRFTHHRDLRALTVREAARFQSFDDSLMFLGGAEQQMRHVGNAAPVLLAKLLSVPIEADNDSQAIERADEFAMELIRDAVIVGHLELVGEADEGASVKRPVYVDPGFAGQVPSTSLTAAAIPTPTASTPFPASATSRSIPRK